jgi:DNA-binding IclR family transcriptional regulator
VTITSQERNLSVGKSAALLRAVAEHPDGLSLAALARATAIPRPTARRLIDALAAERLVVRLRDRDTILLGPGLVELARAVPQTRLLVEAAQAPLDRLVADINESASLVVEQSDGTLTGVLHIDASRRLRPASWVGQVWRPLPSATGRVLLAALSDAELAARLNAGGPGVELSAADRDRLRRDLDAVRKAGFAYGANELEDGLAVVAVPVQAHGVLRAIATVSAPTTRLGADDAAFVAGELQRAAAEIA